MSSQLGKWRSPVAHSAGGRAVAGSNPVFPTTPRLHLIGAGKSYWGDLRLIREARKITLDQVHAETRIPESVLKDFERDGLSLHEHFNDVYRLSLVVAFAGAVGVDPEIARASFAASETRLYDGQLAATYLDWSPPSPPSTGENTPARRNPVDTVARRQRRLARSITANSRNRLRRHSDGRVLGVLLLVVVLVTVVAWFLGTTAWFKESSAMSASMASSGMHSESSEPMTLLGDPIELTLVARYGVLNPLLVRIDEGRSNPYWLELGDSMTLSGTNTFSIRGDIDRLSVSIADRELPLEQFADGRTVVVDRADIQRFLRASTP